MREGGREREVGGERERERWGGGRERWGGGREREREVGGGREREVRGGRRGERRGRRRERGVKRVSPLFPLLSQTRRGGQM